MRTIFIRKIKKILKKFYKILEIFENFEKILNKLWRNLWIFFPIFYSFLIKFQSVFTKPAKIWGECIEISFSKILGGRPPHMPPGSGPHACRTLKGGGKCPVAPPLWLRHWLDRRGVEPASAGSRCDCATTALPDPANWSVSRLPLREILQLYLVYLLII